MLYLHFCMQFHCIRLPHGINLKQYCSSSNFLFFWITGTEISELGDIEHQCVTSLAGKPSIRGGCTQLLRHRV